MMLSFIYCWDYCWKCEFDKDVKIENYNHHDGEQLLFYQKVLIKTELKEEYSLYYCIILLKERRTPIYLIKTVAKRNLNRTLNANSAWRKLTWMNRDWTGKLQVTLISTYISRKKFCSQTFKASSEELIVMYSEKIEAKCMKEDVWKRFFSLTCSLASRNFMTD